jgi:hypothetical protein
MNALLLSLKMTMFVGLVVVVMMVWYGPPACADGDGQSSR